MRTANAFLPVIGALAPFLPQKIQQKILDVYSKDVSPMTEQHRALFAYATEVNQQIGKRLFKHPQTHVRTLDPRHFEPYRYQSLVVRNKLFDKYCLNVSTAQGIREMQRFLMFRPDYMQVLIQNIQAGFPFTHSAAWQAQGLVSKTLDLFAHVIDDPKLRQEYGDFMIRLLKEIISADLPAFEPQQPSLSIRADNLLKSLVNAQKTDA
jgi:hypothetical protein